MVVDLKLATGKYGCTEVRVYPAECGEQLGRDPSKIGSSKSLVLKSFWVERTFWDSSLLVSLTLWDTPVLFTPPLPLPQLNPSLKSSGASRGSFTGFLHGGASLKGEKAHSTAWKKGPENRKDEVKLRPPQCCSLKHSLNELSCPLIGASFACPDRCGDRDV